MSVHVLDELTRVIAYGGIGVLIGYASGLYVSDRHRVISEVLDEAERDVPSKRRRLSKEALNNVVVIGLMVMMLLTGVVWLQSDQENAEQDKRECLRAAATAQALRERTRNYLESAESEQRLWSNLRTQLIAMGGTPKSPLVRSIDTHIADQRTYLNHLRKNPVPRGDVREC